MAGLVDGPRQGPRKPEPVLSEADRAELTCWARRAKTAQLLALRATIVLRRAEGATEPATHYHQNADQQPITVHEPEGRRLQRTRILGGALNEYRYAARRAATTFPAPQVPGTGRRATAWRGPAAR
jgi:hypothetical protein